jgi:hypothetical protein
MDNHKINIKVTHQRVVINTEKSRTELNLPGKQQMKVVTFGRQGPVGSVTERVLTIAQEAITIANQANQANQSMVSGMSLALDHYIGAIGAQE